MPRLLPLFLLFLAGCTSGDFGGGFLSSDRMPLAKNSTPLADIVIAPDADENLRFAADELKLHLDKITGACFSIVSRPAEGRKSLRIAYNPKLAKQELGISFSSAGVALESGGFPEYAVWDFLRDYCGVNWLDPTDAGTIIPSDPNLAVKRKDRKDRPFAKGRNPGNISAGGAFGGAYSPELWKRGSHGWTNYLHVAYPSAFTNKTFAAAEREIARRKNLFLRRMKAGGEISHACHSFYGWYDRFWNKSHPKFEQFRPDFFAKGYEKEKRPPQLCYSNPDVIKQAVADVRAYFDNGDKKGYQWGKDACCLEPMDNSSFCQCEKCVPQYRPELALLSSQQSDYWFRFVNAVAREVAKTHPDKKVSTLAYYTHCGVPTFRLEPNVLVHYCFTCNRIPYAQRCARQEGQLRDWRAAYPDRPFGLWLYNTFPKEYAERSTLVNCFPGFFAHVLAGEYALLGALDISENIFNCGFVDDYENYLSLRWMWDPREPLEWLEIDYLKTTHQTVELAWKVLGTPEVMRELAKLMAEAERLADTPQAKARVANWRAGIFDYMTAGAAASRNPPPPKPWP